MRALHAVTFNVASARRALRGVLAAFGFSVALVGAQRGHAENWIDIPGAEECRVDTDSTAYDAQADVVAFRYQCTGAQVSSIAVACTGNESWRAASPASPGALPRGSFTDWLTEFLRGVVRVAPVSGTYTDPAPIERGTPIGRGRQFVCDTKDRYKPFQFTGRR